MFFRTNSSPHQNEIATRLLEILLDQTKDEVKSIEAEDNSALQTLKLLVIGYLESETHGGTTNEIMDGAKSLIEECRKYGVDPRDMRGVDSDQRVKLSAAACERHVGFCRHVAEADLLEAALGEQFQERIDDLVAIAPVGRGGNLIGCVSHDALPAEWTCQNGRPCK